MPDQKLKQEVDRLRKEVEEVLATFPKVDPQNVWHTLLLLKKSP